MVIMLITPPLTTDDNPHIATDWQIAEDETFTDDSIVIESINDASNLTAIIFNITLDPNKEYYGRARLRFKNNVSEWSDINVIQYDDKFALTIQEDLPGVVTRPIVKLEYPGSDNDNNYTNVPGSLFKIITSNISSTSNAMHVATNWIITDIKGDVKYTSLQDSVNKTSLLFRDTLDAGYTYLIFVSHISSSNDVSQPGVAIFTVYDVPEIQVTSNLEDVSVTEGYALTLQPVNNIKNIYLTIYGVRDDSYEEIYSATTNKFVIGLPSTIYKENVFDYVLALQYEDNNGNKTKVKYFKLNNVH